MSERRTIKQLIPPEGAVAVFAGPKGGCDVYKELIAWAFYDASDHEGRPDDGCWTAVDGLVLIDGRDIVDFADEMATFSHYSLGEK